MSYPYISRAEARAYLLAFDEAAAAGTELPTLPETRQSDGGTEQNWDTIGEEVFAILEKNRLAVEVKGGNSGSEFEANAGPALHAFLLEHPALADADFWIWLTLAHAQSIVRWRYADKSNARNFGVGGGRESFLYRLWLRAEIGRSPGAKDIYALAKLGDIDFWRSHIFRQGYGEVRHFAHALVRFQFPEDEGGKPRLKVEQIRALAKRLKRARSNLMFELMSDSRSTQFIESEWQRLASELT